MKKTMFIFMMLISVCVKTSAECEEFNVPWFWTCEDIVTNLKQPNSRLNQYLKYHEERDAFIAESLGTIQTATQDSEAFKERQRLREEKRLLHLE